MQSNLPRVVVVGGGFAGLWAARAALLTFVVVGGGPTGVELAGTLAEIARHTLVRDFRRSNPRSAQVLLVEGSERILGTFPPALSRRAQAQLEALGVTVLTGTPVTDIGKDGLQLGGRRIDAGTMLWAAGVQASALGRQLNAALGTPLDRSGRVLVNPDLTVPGHPEILVVGDLASLKDASGRPVPGVAPAAKQMGRHVAGVHLSGSPAWWFWLVTHVYFLIGFRNRLVVLIDWAWAYLSYSRSARIIVGEQREDQSPD